MSLKQKEEEVIQPPDLDAMKTILEGAEIDYEEDLQISDSPVLYLDNGIVMRFGSDKELVSMGLNSGAV